MHNSTQWLIKTTQTSKNDDHPLSLLFNIYIIIIKNGILLLYVVFQFFFIKMIKYNISSVIRRGVRVLLRRLAHSVRIDWRLSYFNCDEGVSSTQQLFAGANKNFIILFIVIIILLRL